MKLDDITKAIEVNRYYNEKSKSYTWSVPKNWNKDIDNSIAIKKPEEISPKKRGAVLYRNFFIIDLDNHHNKKHGLESLHEWMNQHNSEEVKKMHRDIKSTLIVKTPRDGYHIWFAIPDAFKTTEFSPGLFIESVDLLAGKKWAPMPGVEREDGVYQIASKIDEIKEAPTWVVKLFYDYTHKKKKSKHRTMRPSIFDEESIVRRPSKNRNVKSSEVHTIFNNIVEMAFEGFEAGTRHNQMTSLIGSIVNQIKYKKLTTENGIRLIRLANDNSRPPLDQNEINQIWNDLLSKEGL